MSNIVKVAGAALSVLALTSVVTQAGNSNRIINGPVKMAPVKFGAIPACAVAGSPSEFPDDVWIGNKGLATMPAGTKIHWSVPFANKQGNYTLASSLAPGKGVYLSGVLPGGVEAGRPCSAVKI